MSGDGRMTPLDGVDLVEGVGRLWAGRQNAPETALCLRPGVAYRSWGTGRLVLSAAFAHAVASGAIDGSERVTLGRSRDWGDRGVLSSLGAGLDPTLWDLMAFATALEDGEAAIRLTERLGRAALRKAATGLGLEPEAADAYPEAAPEVTAEGAAAAFLHLPEAAGEAGMVRLFALMRASRYRWRVRTRLDDAWELATAGSRTRQTVEEVALWHTAGGWASAAIAWTDVTDPWRAEYVMGDAFRRVVEAVGAPVGGTGEGEGR